MRRLQPAQWRGRFGAPPCEGDSRSEAMQCRLRWDDARSGHTAAFRNVVLSQAARADRAIANRVHLPHGAVGVVHAFVSTMSLLN
jgi:hypothetical protein